MTLFSMDTIGARTAEDGPIGRYLAGRMPDVSIGSVRDVYQLEQACRLLYREYRRRGYCGESRTGLYFSPYMLGEHSRTFVVEQSHRVLGTVSVFPNDTSGVPAESLYPDEIRRLREKGVRFVEVGLLATDSRPRAVESPRLGAEGRLLPVLLLFKIVLNYALSCALSHLLIAVHPRHRTLYEALGFRQFAEARRYPAVCDNPAIPMVQDLEREIRRAAPALRHFFLARPFFGEHFARTFTQATDPFLQLFAMACHADGHARGSR